MRAAHRFIAVALACGALAACSEAPPPPLPVETEVPEELRRQTAPGAAVPAGVSVGTPMQERTATIGVLNKRNNIAQDLTMKPGETRRIGDVIVALKACERTAPWEMPQETGAFVQVWVQQGGGPLGFAKVFSGWLFRESPGLNVVEHPIYDVWVKDCAMRFPGEEGAGTTGPAGAARPAPTRAPVPAPTASTLPAAPSPVPAETNEATA